jgi:hypothetical protein
MALCTSGSSTNCLLSCKLLRKIVPAKPTDLQTHPG